MNVGSSATLASISFATSTGRSFCKKFRSFSPSALYNANATIFEHNCLHFFDVIVVNRGGWTTRMRQVFYDLTTLTKCFMPYGEKRTQLSCARDKAELCSYENVRLDTAQLCPRIARMCERTSLLRAGHTPFGRSRAVCEQMKASSKHSSTVPSHSSASC